MSRRPHDPIIPFDPDQEYVMQSTTDLPGPRKLTDEETALINHIAAQGGDLHRVTLRGNKPWLAALRTLVADGFVFRSKYAGHFILFDRHNLPKETIE